MFTGLTGLVILLNGYEFKMAEMFVNIPLWVTTIYGATIFLVLFPFGMYHWLLVLRNRTTNEEMRGKYSVWKGNPFDLGWRKNCRAFWRYQPSAIIGGKI